MTQEMNKEIFNFDDNRSKERYFRDKNLYTKIKFCFKYLENYLPVNKVSKDNTFDFSTLKIDEGKNYDWFFLVSDNVKLLFRQYGNHFTIFALNIHKEGDYFNKMSQFSIHDNLEKISDKIHDHYVDNPFLSIEKMLPQLFKMVEEGDLRSMWNDLCLEREKFTEVKTAFVGDEGVDSLDDVIFGCDELFQMYLEKFSENEMLEKIKTLKVGDMFSSYKITKIRTEVEDEYYHGVGLNYINTNFPDSKADWSDVYSLTRWHYDEIFGNPLEKHVSQFCYKNHDVVFAQVCERLDGSHLFFIAQMTNVYFDIMIELFVKEHGEITGKDFKNGLRGGFTTFVEHAYYMHREKNPVEVK